MAAHVQVLLSLICVLCAQAQLNHHSYFNIPGLHHQAPPYADAAKNNLHHNAWFHHFVETDEPPFHSASIERDDPYLNVDPFFHRDPYFHGDSWDDIGMPDISNTFHFPNGGYNSHRHQLHHRGSEEKLTHDNKNESSGEKPEEKPKDVSLGDKTTNHGKDHKLPEIKNSSEILPPKTNAIEKNDDKGDKDGKQVDVDKKKDYLLVGQGTNGNSIYLLHENIPNPSTVITPNGNQAGNNIVYVPFNPGQTTNPVYQLVNGQTAPLPSNMQMTQDKIGVNGYNTAVQNPGQSTANYVTPGSQNPGYVTIYSNGQMIQIPGVVVNQAPNNVPIQNGNAIQGTSYVVANTVPNNMQNAIQNPGSNVIYATLPNQGTNGPIIVQIPNCMHAMPSSGCSQTAVQNPVQGVNSGINVMPNNGLSSNVVYQLNPNTPVGVSNNYAQPNMVSNPTQGAIAVTIPNQDLSLNNQNAPVPQYQPTVAVPVNSGSNGYNQPMVLNQGQVSNQGGVLNNQDMQIQTAVQMPVGSGANGYNQPIVSSQRQEVNLPNQGDTLSNQNLPLQPAVEIPINSGMTGYNQPVDTNVSPIVNVESRDEITNAQNMVSQPTQVLIQGDQGTNNIGNSPNPTEALNQSGNEQPLATSTSSIILDSNNLSSLGAQPAIMISGFKEKSDKKDKNKSKDKKEKKDKGKKKDKKPKDEEKPKDAAPFTNKKI